LIHLEIRGNLIETLSQLNTPKLQRLYAAANQIKSLTDLDKLAEISMMHVRGNQIETLDVIRCPKLTYLNLRYFKELKPRDNKIAEKSEIKKLSSLPSLKILVLSGIIII
jgi:Leucine-rich repeat (LRR) protein